MFIRIQPNDAIPIYRQIVEQIRRMAASGRLPPGTRLPSVRSLAEQLLVNHNTVARAYRMLEREGVAAGRQGHGVFITDQTSPFRSGERAALLHDSVDRLLTEATELRVELEDLVALLRARARLHPDRSDAASDQQDERQSS